MCRIIYAEDSPIIPRDIQTIKNRIKELLVTEDISSIDVIAVQGGNSLSRNYCVSFHNQPLFFAKVYPCRNGDYPLLQKIMGTISNGDKLVAVFRIGNNCCLITNWIEGSGVHGTVSEAQQTARILQSIHAMPVPIKARSSDVYVELLHYRIYLSVHQVNFPHKVEITSFLKENSGLSRNETTLTHGDVHQGNLIVDSRGTVHLVDYENFAVRDPWRDFVYTCFFHARSENPFWKEVLQTYFNGHVPAQFWATMKYYCYLHLLRMVICEHQKGNSKTIDLLANSIWKGWNCKTDSLPKWVLA